jgi:cell division protein FtsB
MRRRNREITIFNLSMLDVICGALGAFLFLVAILVPYYRKDLAAQIRRLQETVAELRQEVDETREELETAERRVEELEERLAKTFLVVLMKWTTDRQDVDLHVVDPTGAEFYFQRRTNPGRPGELTEDDLAGPGNEIWSVPEAPPGEYRIYYNLYSRSGNPGNPEVTGRVFFRDGSRELRTTRLTQERVKVLVATVVVGADGGVAFR